MKIIQFLGGLGNQMYQYAFLLSLRRYAQPSVNEDDVTMDAGLFRSYRLHQGFELPRLFDITAREATREEIRQVYHRFFLSSYNMSRVYRRILPPMRTEVREAKDRAFHASVLQQKGDRYYVGYWQDYRYFETNREEILHEFKFKNVLDSRNDAYCEKARNTHSVSIHVRMGDYTQNKIFGGICTLDYYAQAIQYIFSVRQEPLVFFIFSDNIAWCREHLVPLLQGMEFEFIDFNRGAESYKDMQMMSQCHTHIIANSSFSFWGAYLCTHPDNLVIAPGKWTNTGQACIRPLHEWIKIDNR